MEQKPIPDNITKVGNDATNVNENIEIEDIVHHGNSYHSHSHGHSHKHSHTHHSRNRGNGNSNKRKKVASFFKKYKSILINIAACSVAVILLVILAVTIDKAEPVSSGEETQRTEITQNIVKIETSIYPDEISLVSNAVGYYLDTSNNASAIDAYRAFDGYIGGLDKGVPIEFFYRAAGLPLGVSVESVRFEISENDTYSNPLIYLSDTDAETIYIYNLKAGTKYYYRLNFVLSNDCLIGTNGSFKTEASPRILNIDGAVNVRDIGGWTTTDGETVRQGLLFRGSELDGAIEPTYLLTDKGLKQLTSELGVRFDMDLRPASDNKSGVNALGNNVIHKYYDAPMYSDVFKDEEYETVRSIFADLADPGNYPIYLHCTYGRDRTGTIAYLLEALLGLSDKDLYTEYELSLFTDSFVNYAEFETFTERIRSLEGDTTKQKVEGWLLSIGVTEEELASIKEIFLEK